MSKECLEEFWRGAEEYLQGEGEEMETYICRCGKEYHSQAAVDACERLGHGCRPSEIRGIMRETGFR